MTTDAPLTPEEAEDALAAELVLGVLEGEERAGALRRLERDSGFAARVSAWEARLAPLNEEFAPLPPPDLLPRIEARLFPAPERPSARMRIAALVGAALGAVAALVLAAAFLMMTPAPPVTTRLADAATAYQATFDGSRLTVTRTTGTAAPAGRVHELWIIPPDQAPISLGLLQDGPLVVAWPTPPAGWTLAITDEPAGGAPGGAPTGPVLMSAQIVL